MRRKNAKEIVVKKILVSYFSATGTTEKTARTLAKAIGADWRAGRRFEVGTGEAALADWAKAVLG